MNTVVKHGGLDVLLAKLLQPDWGERAEREEKEREDEMAQQRAVAAERKQLERERQRRRRNPEQRVRFLTMLRDRDPLSNRDLAKVLNLSRERIWHLFIELEEIDFVEATEHNRRSSNQRYWLTTTGREALRGEAPLRELLARPADGITLKDFLEATGDPAPRLRGPPPSVSCVT